MAYKLTGDQTERVFDYLRFLQDTILHLEDDSVKKKRPRPHKEKKSLWKTTLVKFIFVDFIIVYLIYTSKHLRVQ